MSILGYFHDKRILRPANDADQVLARSMSGKILWTASFVVAPVVARRCQELHPSLRALLLSPLLFINMFTAPKMIRQQIRARKRVNGAKDPHGIVGSDSPFLIFAKLQKAWILRLIEVIAFGPEFFEDTNVKTDLQAIIATCSTCHVKFTDEKDDPKKSQTRKRAWKRIFELAVYGVFVYAMAHAHIYGNWSKWPLPIRNYLMTWIFVISLTFYANVLPICLSFILGPRAEIQFGYEWCIFSMGFRHGFKRYSSHIGRHLGNLCWKPFRGRKNFLLTLTLLNCANVLLHCHGTHMSTGHFTLSDWVKNMGMLLVGNGVEIAAENAVGRVIAGTQSFRVGCMLWMATVGSVCWDYCNEPVFRTKKQFAWFSKFIMGLDPNDD